MRLTEEEKTELLGMARAVIEAEVTGGPAPEHSSGSPGLAEGRGAFVTLHSAGRLRGCIGTFSSDKPLHLAVAEMAVSAATKDPRFMPVTAGELGAIDIEISALTPLVEITDPEEVEVGRHGIFITRGPMSGVLLPQVAVEWGFDRDAFLDATCEKAGLQKGCWRERSPHGEALVRIYVFEAEIFKEA